MKKSSLICWILLIGAWSFPVLSSFSDSSADLLITNAKILSVDAAFGVYSCMAVGDGRILAVGTLAEMAPFRGEKTRVADLQGKTVMPGLIDSHTHPAAACLTEFDRPVPAMQSIQDVLDYIQSRVKTLKEGEWVWVSQVFLTRLKEERYPTRAELDNVAPNNPAVFQTGPDASVNTLALKLSGVDKNWKVDDGGPGYAEKEAATGEPTGILRSCTRYLKPQFFDKKPTQDEHRQKLKELLADYNRVGVVGVGERDADDGEIALYQSLLDRGELTVRAYLSKHVDTIQPEDKIRQAIRDIASLPLFKGDEWLRVGCAKVYLDGGMLTGSAYMRQPWGVSKFYNITDPNYRGLCFIPQDKLLAILETCMENNVQFNAHSVGDGAVHAIIDGCDALKDRFNIREKRPVICHSNFMSEEAVQKVAQMGICMDIQPAWLFLDGRTLTNQFGVQRLTWFQPLHSLFALGAIAGGGSDHMQKIGSLRSINFYDPWLAMWTTLTRQAKWTDRPLHPEQALSRVEAIRFYTINNAYIHCAERQRGSLEPGKLADYIVLDRDLLTCPVDEIKDLQILETYLGGKRIYAKM
jgi:predicted amidohydrolase YtcJ